MTTTAVGVRLGVFGPPPQPPTRGLIFTAGVLQDFDRRYFAGIDMFSYPHPGDTAQWNPCNDDGTLGFKQAGEPPDEGIFDPVAVYLEVVCSTFSIAGLRERARVSLEAGTPKAVEFLLATGEGAGVGGNTNPFLGDSNCVLPNGTTAVSAREAVAILEDYAARNYGARPMLHASPGTVDMLSSILEEDDSGTIYTQAGTPMVPGQGYAGVNAAGNAPGTNKAWIFVSSPVEVRMSDIEQHDLRSSLDRSDNTVSFITERYVLVDWDTTLQAAVLADWSLAS